MRLDSFGNTTARSIVGNEYAILDSMEDREGEECQPKVDVYPVPYCFSERSTFNPIARQSETRSTGMKE